MNLSLIFRYYISISLAFVFSLSGCVASREQLLNRKDLSTFITPSTNGIEVNFSKLNEIIIFSIDEVAGLRLEESEKKTIIKKLENIFELHTSASIVNPRKHQNFEMNELDKINSSQQTQISKALELGKALNSQAVLFGNLSKLSPLNNKNGDFAEVSFRLWLLDVEQGRIVWTAAFNHKDEPLSENLLRLKEVAKAGVARNSVSEILEQGFIEAAKALEMLRR